MDKANAILLREAGSDRLHVHKITEEQKASPNFVDLGEGGEEYSHIDPDCVVFVHFEVTPLDEDGTCAFTVKELNIAKLEKEGQSVVTATQALNEGAVDKLIEIYSNKDGEI